MVKTSLLTQGVSVQSLDGQLRYHLPHGVAKKNTYIHICVCIAKYNRLKEEIDKSQSVELRKFEFAEEYDG